MSPRSPHVNMRIGRDAHDQLARLALDLSAAAGRRLSLTDVLDVAVLTTARHRDTAIKIAKGEGSQPPVSR